MNEALLRIALTTKATFWIVISRPKILSQGSGLPQLWDFSLFPPSRVNKAYKMYNNGLNLPGEFETYMFSIQLPAMFTHRIPLDTINLEMIKALQ